MPLLAILGFGTVDLGRVYAMTERIRNAAREAAFYAASHPGQQHSTGGACADPANADWRGAQEGHGTYTFTYAPNVATCNPASAPGPGTPLKVTASAAVPLFAPLIGTIVGNPLKISASVCVAVAGGTPKGACP